MLFRSRERRPAAFRFRRSTRRRYGNSSSTAVAAVPENTLGFWLQRYARSFVFCSFAAICPQICRKRFSPSANRSGKRRRPAIRVRSPAGWRGRLGRGMGPCRCQTACRDAGSRAAPLSHGAARESLHCTEEKRLICREGILGTSLCPVSPATQATTCGQQPIRPASDVPFHRPGLLRGMVSLSPFRVRSNEDPRRVCPLSALKPAGQLRWVVNGPAPLLGGRWLCRGGGAKIPQRQPLCSLPFAVAIVAGFVAGEFGHDA